MTNESKGEAWADEQYRSQGPICFPKTWADEDRCISGEWVRDAMADPTWSKGSTGLKIADAIITSPIGGDYLIAEGEITFERCRFQGSVSLLYAEFRRVLRFQSCIFEKWLDLTGLRVNHLLQFGKLDDHPGNQFLGAVSMRNATVSGHMNFDQSVFMSSVALSGVRVRGNLECLGCKFQAEDAPEFSGIVVGEHVVFDGTSFQGGLDISFCKITGQLQCDKVIFGSHTQLANFNAARIRGGFFREAHFSGPINFVTAQIEEELNFGKAVFSREASGPVEQHEYTATVSPPQAARYDFSLMEARGWTNFSNAEFADNVSFSGAIFRNLTLRNSIFRKNLDLSNASLQELNLTGAEFAAFVDLSDTKIDKTLYVHTPPTKLPERADLRALVYERIEMEKGKIAGNASQWRDWLSLTPRFTPSAHIALESALRGYGYQHLANQVYLEMRRAERNNLWHEELYGKYVASWFFELTVGYGVRGWLLFVWAFFVLLSAWIVFTAGFGAAAATSKVVLYTIDVFLPVDLGQTLPGMETANIRVIKFLTSLSGWILVPLALAQLGGLLKRYC